MQGAAVGRLEKPVVCVGVSGIEIERSAGNVGVNGAVCLVDQRQSAVAEPICPTPEIVLSTFVSVVVEVVPRIDVRGAIRQSELATALESDAIADDLKLRLVSGGVQRDGAGIVDRAAERQHRAVADRHAAGVRR